MGKVQGIVWDLTHAEATIECVWDPTLHLGSLGKGRNGNAGTDTMPACQSHAQMELRSSCKPSRRSLSSYSQSDIQ